MAPIPTVGEKQLHIGQLSPRVRRILKHRAAAANQREYAPVLAADRSAIGGVNRDYRTQAQSIRGATHMSEAAISQAIRGLRKSGLSGGYLKQALHELTARQGDAASSVPFLLSDAQEARSKGLQDARQQLLTDQAAKQQGTASDFNSALESQRSRASTVLKEQADKRAEGGKANEGLNNAAIALHDFISHWKKDPELQEQNPLASTADFVTLAHGLTSGYEGVSLSDAAAVIARLRKRWEHHPNKALKGLVLNPGTE